MADDELFDTASAETAERQDVGAAAGVARDTGPEKLRVHSLARALGTTSRRVLDALAELDGRVRNVHSSVDANDAEKVREVITADPVTETGLAIEAEATAIFTDAAASAPQPPETPQGPAADETPVVAPAFSHLAGEEPTSAPAASTEQGYMPLFVEPQPVAPRKPARDDDADDDSDDSDDADDDRDENDDDSDGDEPSEKPSARRRRRGRRGRGRGRGEQNGADSDDADDDASADGEDSASSDDDSDDGDDDNGDDEAGTPEGASRRRRRRRRRKSNASSSDDSSGDAGDGSSDDPPNTVVHERAPRSKGDRSDRGDSGEIQGITGSTRLEAKRQRRRDGRDAGRRRPPILSEAEFLARRESVERVMVVRDKVRTEPPHTGARYTQIAVLEDGVVVEHFVTSAASASLVGNIYLGIVQNVLPSMEAAFIDIGRGRNGVLYAGEVNWEAAGLAGAKRTIESALKPGDYVVVQVSKDPVGHKGARLTTQVSLAGRYLVYVPGASSTGISRKLPDTERQRLKEILREVVPADAGAIIRTASEGVKEDDIRADVSRLQDRWRQIDEKAAETKGKASGAAVPLYEEPDVLVKVIRDLFNEDFSQLIVSGENAWGTIHEYVDSVASDLVSKLNKYEPAEVSGGQSAPDVFAVHRIDEQLAKAMDRKVWLPSGGTLVIDRTEAMTVVDVNTGKFTGSGGNLEQTVTKNNLEAAEEIVRQLRLRDIGGIVVIDFIDMVLESNRDLVLRRLTEALARDRTRHQVSEVTSLGLVQLTRKRLGTGLVEAFSTPCPHCAGRGILLHADPVDSTSAPRSKSESGGRRGKRSRKKGGEEPAVAKVPSHTPGEHPMFKAMAAANGKHEDDDEPDENQPSSPEDERDDLEKAVKEVADDDLDGLEEEDEFDDADDSDDSDDDTDDSDDDSDDDDEDIEVDLDEDDEDLDDDIEDIDPSAEDSDDDDSDDSDDDDDEDEEPEVVVRPRRRRAAARPAGPPVHD